MRTIQSETIARAVAQAAIEANTVLPADIYRALQAAREAEKEPRARQILGVLIENADLAKREKLALCQDTGLVVVSIVLGQEVHVEGSLQDAVNQGIRDGYRQGHFRASVVDDPLLRNNTGDNTPAIIHTQIVEGSGMTITVFPKGAGSENMGQVAMLKPGAGEEGIIEFVVNAVKTADANPCPPIVIGLGIGGNLEQAPYLAKQALMRPLDTYGPHRELEQKILARINQLGIGPQGLGGDITALGVNIESAPTHIASLPVAVNLGCHSTRRSTVEL